MTSALEGYINRIRGVAGGRGRLARCCRLCVRAARQRGSGARPGGEVRGELRPVVAAGGSRKGPRRAARGGGGRL